MEDYSDLSSLEKVMKWKLFTPSLCARTTVTYNHKEAEENPKYKQSSLINMQ